MNKSTIEPLLRIILWYDRICTEYELQIEDIMHSVDNMLLAGLVFTNPIDLVYNKIHGSFKLHLMNSVLLCKTMCVGTVR